MLDLSILEPKPEWAKLVTFIPNKKVPIHNWFYFKEGFSRDFVIKIFDIFKVREGMKILDPFCGSGTTLLVAKEFGIDACGVDASPLAVFVTQVKLADYDIDELNKVSEMLFKKGFRKCDIGKLSWLTKAAFSKYALEDIAFFKEEIKQIEDPKIRNFFTLALMNSANKVSYAIKDGSYIRIHKKPHPPLRKVFKAIIKKMIKDLKRFKCKGSNVEVILGDARDLKFLTDEEFDAIITSPPYLNKIEYTKVYRIEYELFFPHVKVDSLRSYIGMNTNVKNDPFPELQLPLAAKAYLSDINKSLEEIRRVSKIGAKIALVIAEGAFPDRIVPCDLLIAELAERIGFHIDKIFVAAKRVVTRDRTIKIGRARESVILMQRSI
ncbi:MAG: class I SAM-dependent methyltransferase [Nitrososphaerales archaeon]